MVVDVRNKMDTKYHLNRQKEELINDLLSKLEKSFSDETTVKGQFVGEITNMKRVISKTGLKSQADWIALKLLVEDLGRHLFSQGVELSLEERTLKSELSKIISEHENNSRGNVGLLANLVGIFR